ncbi:MAG: hypothetical protein QM790_06920 [Nibricoccus sp.]
MIARSLVTACLLFTVYSAVLRSAWVRDHALTQSQWQGNLIRAQEYSANQSVPANVIVGSSLTARLESTPLSKDFYSLSFSGGGPLTGLKIITSATSRPKLVLIETNLLMESVSDTMLANTQQPVFAPLRAHFPALRERFQPANIAVGTALERSTEYGLRALRRVISIASVETSSGADDLFQAMLAEQQKNMSRPPDEVVLAQRLEQLKEQVAALGRTGTRVVFVEMPVDASLMNLPYLTTLRTKIAKTFPDIPFVRPPASHVYRTEDALHLGKQEATVYASLLHGELAHLNLLP